jgi:phenylpyruvate tautomerase PptA (4-oxalocrotonate tautomerase family)
MPTYVCWARRGQISDDQKQRIATEITLVHSECTGAPAAFVQCVFQDIDAAGHYIGGVAAQDSVWVYGHIRDGRDTEVKEQILIRISELLVDVLQLDPSLTWVYINPLANTDMVEFGHTACANTCSNSTSTPLDERLTVSPKLHGRERGCSSSNFKGVGLPRTLAGVDPCVVAFPWVRARD